MEKNIILKILSTQEIPAENKTSIKTVYQICILQHCFKEQRILQNGFDTVRTS